MYEEFEITKEIQDLANEVESELKPIFENIENICKINSIDSNYSKSKYIEHPFSMGQMQQAPGTTVVPGACCP